MYKIIWIIVWPIFRLLFPVKTYNKKLNYPKGKGLVISNHFSNMDVLIALSCHFENYALIGKKELFKNKFVNWFFRKMGAFPIDRQNNDIKAILTCVKVLKNGKKMIIYPEGTRNKINTELQEVKGGVGLMSIKAKVPLIPIMLLKKPKMFRRTHVMFGKPFELTDYYDKKLTSDDFDKISQIIYGKMVETQTELKEKMASRGKRKKLEKRN